MNSTHSCTPPNDPIAQILDLSQALRFLTVALASDDGEQPPLSTSGAACLTDMLAERLEKATEHLMQNEDARQQGHNLPS